MIVILRLDHRLLYLSPFTQQLTGYQARDTLGKNYFAIFVPEATAHESFAEELNRIAPG